MKKIAIMGAGLSGLACARELAHKGHQVDIFEKQDQIGGKVRSDKVDGFILDHGFQVYLSAYETGQYFYQDKLKLNYFAKGAIIKKQGRHITIADPLENPGKLLSTAFAPIGSLWDKFLILLLKKNANSLSETIDLSMSTMEFLKSYGFSRKMINNFFIPFFSGIFLETKLETPAHFFLYLFDKFSISGASLPQEGMNQLAQSLLHPNIKIHLNQKLENHKQSDFDQVLNATSQANHYHHVTTYYFKTKSSKFATKYLYLNADNDGPVNHIACLSAVNPYYSPEGWHLYSVNTLKQHTQTQEIIDHLQLFFGEEEIQQWEFIKMYNVKKALPQKSYYGQKSSQNTCADFLESPSIQGALESGRKLANHILA